jgi:hypothetical protein
MLEFIGVLTKDKQRQAIAELTVQFNRCAVVDLDLDWSDGLVAKSFRQELVDRDAVLPAHAKRMTTYDSSISRYRVEFNRGTIVVVANDFAVAVVRDDPIPKDQVRSSLNK